MFLLVVTVAGTSYYAWHHQDKVEAAYKIAQVNQSSFVDSVKLNINVSPNGKITIEGKDYSNTLKIFPDYYEIRLLLLDQPGVFISNFEADLILPKDVPQQDVQQIVYAIHGIGSNSYYVRDSRTLVYTAQNVSSESSYTVVARFPKSVLNAPLSERVQYVFSQISAKSYIIFAIVLPLITFIVLIFMVIRRRQDQIFYYSKKIIAGPPNNASPAIVGVLTDGKVGPREIAATLIDLANRGYIFITCHAGKTYSFGKRKTLQLESLPELREYERILLSKIFEPDQYKSTGEDVDIRIGRHIFSRKIAQVYLDIYNECTKQGYFINNPLVVHLRWRYAGIASLFLGFAGFLYTAFYAPDPKFTLFLWVGEIIAAFVIVWLSGLMPVRSVTGASALRQWLQFKHFLSMNRLAEGTSGLMDRYCQMLPYAIVFGVETEWTRRYLKETFSKPDWFDTEDMVVTLDVFASALFPIIAYVGGSLDKSHEPTVE